MHRPAAVAALAGALLAAACGVDGGTAANRDDGLLGLLGRVPAAGDTGSSVVLNLHDSAREAAGLTVPDRADEDAVHEYRRALTFEPANGLLLHPAPVTGVRVASLAEWRDELGFDLLDVDADVLAGNPPNHVEVAVGSIEAGAVEDAARADPVWSELLEVGEHGGTTVLSWGEEGEVSFDRVTRARPLGQSARMAVEDGAVAWTRSTAMAEAAVDAWHGDGDSLAGVDELAALAGALDAEGCHAAFLSTDEGLFALSGLPRPPPEPVDPLPRYEAAATGVTVAGGSPAVVVALAYGSAAEARDGAAALERVVAEGSSVVGRRPWSDVVTSAEVRVDGEVVVGVLATDEARLWFDVPATKDSLLLWG